MRRDTTADDLDFFFKWADGEHGPHSGFEAFVSMCQTGAVGGQNATGSASAAHERLIKMIPSVTKWRLICDVLHRLPLEQQRLLHAAHTPLPPGLSAELRPQLGDSSAIVVALYGAGPVVGLALEAKKSVEKRAHLVELRVEADRALQLARFAYWQLAADRAECQAVFRRRRLTDALAARLAAVAPVRLLTTADLREMGAIQ